MSSFRLNYITQWAELPCPIVPTWAFTWHQVIFLVIRSYYFSSCDDLRKNIYEVWQENFLKKKQLSFCALWICAFYNKFLFDNLVVVNGWYICYENVGMIFVTVFALTLSVHCPCYLQHCAVEHKHKLWRLGNAYCFVMNFIYYET